MFAGSAFSEVPFSSLVGVIINGEIFFFDQDIDGLLSLDGTIARSIMLQTEIEQELNFDLHILY